MVKILLSLLLVLSSLLPLTSQAFPATQSGGNMFKINNSNGGTEMAGPFSTSSAAYAANLARLRGAYPSANITELGIGYALAGGMAYSYSGNYWVTHFAVSVVVPITYTCPVGTLSGSSCVCPVGQTDTGSTCVDPNAARCTANSGGSDMFDGFSSFSSVGAAFCPSNGAAASCGAKVTGGFALVKNGLKTWTYEVAYTGSTCVPPVTGTLGNLTTCKGTSSVSNGQVVCIPPSDQNLIESVKSTTAANPTSAASAPGSAGSVTSQETTACTGSKCTTTTTISTTTSAGGTPTVTTQTKDEPKDDFCKSNPRSMACSEIGLGELSATPVTGSTVALSINKAAGFGPESGTCPAPKTAVILGITISMPFTLLCDFANLIRPLLIGFAYLSAALTFFGFAKR